MLDRPLSRMMTVEGVVSFVATDARHRKRRFVDKKNPGRLRDRGFCFDLG
jgi:hypothetical protein